MTVATKFPQLNPDKFNPFPIETVFNKTGHVRITCPWGEFLQSLFQWKNNCCIIWVCICSLAYPACNAYAPLFLLRPVCRYNIFPHYLINGTLVGTGDRGGRGGAWAQFGHEIVQCSTDLEHLYRIYSIPTHDKHQWLLLKFIVLLMMEAKGVRNM